jgi:hypothetical protein
MEVKIFCEQPMEVIQSYKNLARTMLLNSGSIVELNEEEYDHHELTAVLAEMLWEVESQLLKKDYK